MLCRGCWTLVIWSKVSRELMWVKRDASKLHKWAGEPRLLLSSTVEVSWSCDRYKGDKREGVRWRGSSGPPFIVAWQAHEYTQFICNHTKQLISVVQCVTLLMRLHPVHQHGCLDCHEVTVLVVIEVQGGMLGCEKPHALSMAMQSGAIPTWVTSPCTSRDNVTDIVFQASIFS